jgi:hypothetical protein
MCVEGMYSAHSALSNALEKAQFLKSLGFQEIVSRDHTHPTELLIASSTRIFSLFI